MNLKQVRPDGLLKDVSDNFARIVRSFAGEVAAVMAPPTAPAATVEVPVRSGLVIVPDNGGTPAGPLAMTLLDPTAAEDGQVLTLYAVAAEQHTLTLYSLDEKGEGAASKGFNGGANDTATWDGGVAGDVAIGDMLQLVAYNGAWYVLGNVNVTLSESGG